MSKKFRLYIGSTAKDAVEILPLKNNLILALEEAGFMTVWVEELTAVDGAQQKSNHRLIATTDVYMNLVSDAQGISLPGDLTGLEGNSHYAVEKGIPVITVLLPGGKIFSHGKTKEDVQAQDRRKVLEEFLRRQAAFVELSAQDDIVEKILSALAKILETHAPVGYLKADTGFTKTAELEVKRLKKINARLEEKNAELASQLDLDEDHAPDGANELENGDTPHTFSYSCTWEHRMKGTLLRTTLARKCRLTWNQIYAHLSPRMLDFASVDDLKDYMAELIVRAVFTTLARESTYDASQDKLEDFSIYDADFDIILTQLRGLGLIKVKKGARRDNHTYMTLTRYGTRVMDNLLLRRKSPRQETQGLNDAA